MNEENHYIEIKESLSEIKVQNAEIVTTLGFIHEQVKKTNGRVTQLEGEVGSLELTRAENKGTWKTAGAVAGVVTTAFWFLADKILK